MYQLFRHLSHQQLFLRQLPVFVVAFVVASLFYKFGNFAVECLAFLATWAALDFLMGLIVSDSSSETNVDPHPREKTPK